MRFLWPTYRRRKHIDGVWESVGFLVLQSSGLVCRDDTVTARNGKVVPKDRRSNIIRHHTLLPRSVDRVLSGSERAVLNFCLSEVLHPSIHQFINPSIHQPFQPSIHRFHRFHPSIISCGADNPFHLSAPSLYFPSTLCCILNRTAAWVSGTERWTP